MLKNRLQFERNEVRSWLERCLMGPFIEPSAASHSINEEEIHRRPSEIYQCGILYGPWPDFDTSISSGDMEKFEEGIEETADQDKNEWGVEERGQNIQETSKTSAICRYRPPSGVGLSFFVSSDISMDVMVRAARYSKESSEINSQKKIWRRRPLPDNGDHQDVIHLKPSENHEQVEDEIGILSDPQLREGHSHYDKLHVKWRPYSAKNNSGYIVTISVINRAEMKESDTGLASWQDRWEANHLFQLFFQSIIRSGRVYPYPGNDIMLMDEENREFELLYSDKTVYAIGHGVSPDWEVDGSGCVTAIKASFLPFCEVPLMKTDVKELKRETLSLGMLAETAKNVQVTQRHLLEFTTTYEKWIHGLNPSLADLSREEKKTAKTMTARLQNSARRMNCGIQFLDDPLVARAFSFAHMAMLDYMKARNVKEPCWRPFQLGFLLQVLPSLINGRDPDRHVVDLLWFQTGGGKTEAYLAIISFLVAYRRMRYPEKGGGTTVIMRYTLRLLTIQQFERAAVVICALELLRRKYPDILGNEPITAGLWVGSASSPNTFDGAQKLLDGAVNNGGAGLEKFVITECPWCGCKLEMDEDPLKSGFRGDRDGFCFCCSNPACDYGGGDNPVLPINVVDQHLYTHPPTLLLATVDKFAMFAWKEETTVFFGNAYSSSMYAVPGCRPPDLIIQDELHLIAGELGTITGLYEAAFDTVLNLKGCCPKIIASTATIRNAREQVKKLYARDVAVFPSPGLNWSDSFFARVDSENPGRLYMGYYAPNLKRTASFAPLGAGLFLAPPIWNSTDEAVRDAWWTMVAYHGSLRGLGITHNLLSDEVRKYMDYYIYAMLDDKAKSIDEKAIAFSEFCDLFQIDKNQEDYKKKIADKVIEFRGLFTESGVAELTSNRNAQEIRRYLSDLGISYSSENNRAISLLLCTNMVSVGLDIARLGLMVINGQPFTTGEYIQASSRVGRDRVPGIVVAHYFRNHARDMSHYENFRAYHESFYRFVEPTSLTPFSAPSRRRALHGAMVIVMRHAADLLENDKADKMDMGSQKVKAAAAAFLERCQKASPEQFEKTKQHLDQLLFHWNELSGRDGWDFNPLQYHTPRGRSDKLPLLVRFNDKLLKNKGGSGDEAGWQTLQSMRQVDEECGIVFVAPRRKGGT